MSRKEFLLFLPPWLSSIRTVMILLIVLATIFPLGTILYQNYHRGAEALSEGRTLSERIAAQVVYDQQLLLSSAKQLMSTFSYNPVIRRRDTVPTNAFLAELLRENPQITNLVVVDEKGNLWASGLPMKGPANATDRRYFRNAMATGRFSSGEFTIGRIRNKPTILFGYPLKDGSGRITDVAIVSLSSDQYERLFQSKELATDASLTLLDHKGAVLFARPFPTLIGQQDREELFGKMTGGPDEGSFEAVGMAGVPQIFTYRKLRFPGEQQPYMYVRAGVSVSSILARTRKDFLFGMGAIVAGAILILLFSVLLSKRFVLDKVAALKEVTDRLSRGDLSVRVPEIVSGGELGELGNSIDDMARSLQEAEARRQKAEEAIRQSGKMLRESEERFRSIVDTASDGILIAKISTRKFVEANRAICEMLGYTQEELLGLGVEDIHPAPDLPHVVAEFNRQSQGNKRVAEGLPVRRKDGSVFYADISANSIEFGGEQYQVDIFRDITERKRAEEEKRNLERQMQQAQKLESLGVLAGGIAHDFNNILMAVLGHAELALEGISPMSPARGNLAEITKASRRAAELCGQMLAYAGKSSFALEQVVLGELVEEMAHLLKTAISKKAILNLSLERGLPPIQADPSQIRQITMNLIINASEAIGDGDGVIRVSVGAIRCDEEYLQQTDLRGDLPPGLYVYLEVTDTGIGMDAETRARIFEPFFSTKFTGRGLGLAAVLGIVRAHRGAMKVYSEPGKGTTFKILFPALANGEVAALRLEASPLVNWRGTGTILLVEDEESLIALGARMLEHLGFTVLTVADGLQAVELYRQRGKEIDLVLMDLTMPHMDGAEAFGELRRLDPDVRVVLASGYSKEDVGSRFAGKRPAGIIQKPYTISKLREALAGLLPKRPAGEG